MAVKNIETIVGIVEGHEPEQKYDLVIILNPGMDESHSIRSEVLTKHLAQGRYVIANNRHGNAKELFYDDRFGNVGRFTAQGKACSLEANFDDIDETPWSDSPNYVFRKL